MEIPQKDALGSCCLDDSALHCITCSDEAVLVTVLQVEQAAGLALVAVAHDTAEVDVTLIDDVSPGDQLLVHGGVAIARA